MSGVPHQPDASARDAAADPTRRRVILEMLAGVALGVGACGGVWFAAVKLVLEPAFGGMEVDPREGLFAGGAEEAGLSDAVAEAAGVSNVRGWRGGNWGGSIDYVTFDCASLDGCRAAVHELMEIDRYGGELIPFEGVVPTRFAVNLDGPAFYFPEEIPAPWWDVPAVRRGEWSERHRGDDRMDFYLIDPARDRVFHHHESGGFPADPPAGPPRP